MPVKVTDIKKGKHYAAGKQVRRVLKVEMQTVERAGPRKKGVPTRVKKRLKRVRYQSRGHKASMEYNYPVWVDATKFAADVDKQVIAHYDPDYDER